MAEPAVRALELLRSLVACPSLTPDDAGALAIASACLAPAGFTCESLAADGVGNLWATHGDGEPGIVLCGHVDVVSPGDITGWSSDPFTPSERDGKLYGRGATDMKGGLSALLIAATEFVARYPDHTGTIALALTSDEEGPAVAGIRHLVATLRARGLRFAYGLVGEPCSLARFGDRLRVGRRGSLTGTLTIEGKQGHVAYPATCVNPIWALAQVIDALGKRKFAAPAPGMDATSVQVVSVTADAGANNVVPATATALVNFRYASQDEPAGLREWVARLCTATGLPYTCEWMSAAKPYYTGADCTLARAVTTVATEVNGFAPLPSVGGGTSDGRFLVDLCAEVVEFGTIGTTMHQVDEHIVVAELDPLVAIYGRVLDKLIVNAG